MSKPDSSRIGLKGANQVGQKRPVCDHQFIDHTTSKIEPRHLERLAVVYVRQSSPRQVLNNRESRELQYNLVRRAVAYGWHEDRVLIIDEDQGKTGSTAENRLGFHRILAEVGLNHVGLVLGIEMSRLARSCKDWYQLLELCAVFDALLADQEWEEALREQRGLQDQFDRLQAEQPAKLSQDERECIESLAYDLPRLRKTPGTSHADRQAVIRCLVEQVLVTVQGKTEFVDVSIHWVGGFVSNHEIRRPVGRYDMLRDYDRLKERLIELRKEGKSSQQIADALNAEGFYPPRLDHPFNHKMVRMLLCQLELSSPHADSIANEHLLDRQEWWLQDLSRELNIPHPLLSKWCRRGWVHARKVMITRCRWIVWADANEKARLRRLHATRRLGLTRRYPPELTKPK